MTKLILELTEEEKVLLLTRLDGLCALYVSVNSSGDGPLSDLRHKIRHGQLKVELNYYE